MATGLVIFAVILSAGTLIALFFVVALVVTVVLPALKAPPVRPGITDAEAACEMCVHCGVSGAPGKFGNDAEHAVSCPTVTDLWPVQPVDIDGWLTCEICSHVLQLGETYTTARDIRCIGCTVLEPTP